MNQLPIIFLDAHFYNDGTGGGSGVTHLRVFDINDPATQVSAWYYTRAGSNFIINWGNLNVANTSDSATTSTFIYNLSSTSQDIMVERVGDELPVGWSANICKDSCLDATGKSMQLTIPADSTLEIKGYFATDTSDEYGDVKVIVYQVGSPAVHDTITFSVGELEIVSSKIPVKSGPKFVVFPSPATTHLNLFSDHKGLDIVDVYNILGAKVNAYKVNSGELRSINISHMTNGIYFVRFIDQQGSVLKTTTIAISN
ncbi:T9SS type A sorting domain-containing protein [candidate division TA06 bacterium]|nr:T9SS type A sorting domain-containing protein [candidate division TA06 bacterium]